MTPSTHHPSDPAWHLHPTGVFVAAGGKAIVATPANTTIHNLLDLIDPILRNMHLVLAE